MSSNFDRKSVKSSAKSSAVELVKVSIKLCAFENLNFLAEDSTENETDLEINVKFTNDQVSSKKLKEPFDDNTALTFSFEVNAGDEETIFNLFAHPVECKKIHFPGSHLIRFGTKFSYHFQ